MGNCWVSLWGVIKPVYPKYISDYMQMRENFHACLYLSHPRHVKGLELSYVMYRPFTSKVVTVVQFKFNL
jgi:hypothetical protein